jgi:hypothetical protein
MKLTPHWRSRSLNRVPMDEPDEDNGERNEGRSDDDASINGKDPTPRGPSLYVNVKSADYPCRYQTNCELSQVQDDLFC